MRGGDLHPNAHLHLEGTGARERKGFHDGECHSDDGCFLARVVGFQNLQKEMSKLCLERVKSVTYLTSIIEVHLGV